MIAAIVAGCVVSDASAQCPADVDGDGEVAASDLAAVLAAWGSDGGGKLDADLTDDGLVDALDLAALLAAWGPCGPTVPSWATLIEAFPDPAVVYDPALRQRIVDTGYAWRVRDVATQIEMVLIPPGTFAMGCSASNQHSCFGSESPVHSVTLTDAFYLGRHEVTQAEWTARMGTNPSSFVNASAQVPAAQVPDRPVERVSWNMIAGPTGFLSGSGLRLPTEAEWEFACRAGTTTAFHGWPAQPSGTNDDTLAGTIAWFTTNAASQTRPVGQKPANGFGLHDMSGNVMEWVNDWWSSTYYASSPSTNPPGPATGSSRVLRGGAWVENGGSLRVSARLGFTPGFGYYATGFRVARDP